MSMFNKSLVSRCQLNSDDVCIVANTMQMYFAVALMEPFKFIGLRNSYIKCTWTHILSAEWKADTCLM